jgi:hypothetical protein
MMTSQMKNNDGTDEMMVPLTRIERTTSPLPRECSTTELQGQFFEMALANNHISHKRITKKSREAALLRTAGFRKPSPVFRRWSG